jgi:serine phosphatase RsbU (regulator of sigma subunit)
MPYPRKPGSDRPGSGCLSAAKTRLFTWAVMVCAVVLNVTWIIVIRLTDSIQHPLAPVGAVVVSVAAVAAALAGVLAGVVAALAAVVVAFLLLADFSNGIATANALAAGVVWVGAAVATGLVTDHLRRQVAAREIELEQTLDLTASSRDTLARLLDLGPQFFKGETLAEVAATVCDTAVSTFGADSSRLYGLGNGTIDILALSPATEEIRPGFTLWRSDYPDIETVLAQHRPSFVRDLSQSHLKGAARRLRVGIGIVSTVRAPIIGPAGPIGILGLGWNSEIDGPSDESLAAIQRFADQVAIAWQSALRLEAQRRADALNETLHRVVALAPSFHISGTKEEVARAICEAAVATFDCDRGSLYQVQGDRLRVLDCFPPLDSLPTGRTFALSEDMPLVREIRSHKPTFIPDVDHPSRQVRPWPPEIISQAGTRSALYVPVRFTERGPQDLLVLSWTQPRERPDDNFMVVVERFADQLALALASSSAERLHARLEASLLPTAPVDHPLLRAVIRYRTGEHRLRLGGDFVGSTVDAGGILHFIIGDVSGHGPDAAALGATLRSTWKALALAGESLPKTVSVMRAVLLSERRDLNAFATVLAGRIDVEEHELFCINAGHLPPLLITDRVTPLETEPSAPLGFDKAGDRPVHHFPLPGKWSLFCYTDGLIDAPVAPGASQRYGEERLKERLGVWGESEPTDGAVDALIAEIEHASGRAFADDVAVLLIATREPAREACT